MKLSETEANQLLLAGRQEFPPDPTQQGSLPKKRFRLPHAYAVLVEIEVLIKHIFGFCRSIAATPLQVMIPIAGAATLYLRLWQADLMNQFCSEVYNNVTNSTEMGVNRTAVDEALNQTGATGALLLTLEAPAYCSSSQLVTAMTMFFGYHTMSSLLMCPLWGAGMGIYKHYSKKARTDSALESSLVRQGLALESEKARDESLWDKLINTLAKSLGHEMKPSNYYLSRAFPNATRFLLLVAVLAVIIARMILQSNDNQSASESSYIHLIPFASGVTDSVELLREGVNLSPAPWVSFVSLFPPIWLKVVEILLLNMARAELQDTRVPSILRRQIWNQVLGDVILSSSLMPTSLLDKMGAMSLLGMSVANYLVGSLTIFLIFTVAFKIFKCCEKSNPPAEEFLKDMIEIHNPWPGCAFPLDMLKFTTNAAIYVAAHALLYGPLCLLLVLESYRRGCDKVLSKLGKRSWFVKPQSSFSISSLKKELLESEGSELKQFLFGLRLLNLNPKQKKIIKQAINSESSGAVDIDAVINEVEIIRLALEDNSKNNPRELDGLLGELRQHYERLSQRWCSKSEELLSRDNPNGEGLTAPGPSAA